MVLYAMLRGRPLAVLLSGISAVSLQGRFFVVFVFRFARATCARARYVHIHLTRNTDVYALCTSSIRTVHSGECTAQCEYSVRAPANEGGGAQRTRVRRCALTINATRSRSTRSLNFGDFRLVYWLLFNRPISEPNIRVPRAAFIGKHDNARATLEAIASVRAVA